MQRLWSSVFIRLQGSDVEQKWRIEGRILVPALETFAYMETSYLFKERAPEKIEILADDLLAA